MAEGGPRRKRQKWDVPAPGGVIPPGGVTPMNASLASTYVPQGQPAMPQMQQPVGPPSQDVIARAKQGAMSVLEKINQDLRMKGAAPLKGGFALQGEEDRIRREVFINDAPGPIRYKLTLRTTQDDIARRTGTVVVVRGRFLPPGMANNGEEPPLHLKITPGVTASESDAVQQQSVDAAAREVQHILNGGQPGTYQHAHPLPVPGQGMGRGQQQYPPPEPYGGPPHQGLQGPGLGRGSVGYPPPQSQAGRGPGVGYQGALQGQPAAGVYAQMPPGQAAYQMEVTQTLNQEL